MRQATVKSQLLSSPQEFLPPLALVPDQISTGYISNTCLVFLSRRCGLLSRWMLPDSPEAAPIPAGMASHESETLTALLCVKVSSS